MNLADVGPVIGIDFGTTGFRIAALVNGHATMLERADGSTTVPADVLIRADGSSSVGLAARREGPHGGAILIHAAKRVLGRTWADPVVAELKKELGGALVETAAGLPSFVIGDVTRSPEDICRLMFEDVRTMASAALRHDVTHAVLAVPADYGMIQRKALSEIAREAGLTIVRIVGEPTAAALHRGAGAENLTFAIYDLGGGTFDISIVDVGDGVYQVLASDGDPLLGGEDIDLRLQVHVLNSIGTRPEELTPPSSYRLRTAVERLKRELSTASRATLSIEGLLKIDGGEISISQVVERDAVQDICQDLVDRTLVICNRALARVEDDAREGLTVEDIDEVILVGGSTHLPFVAECVTRFFGKEAQSGNRREDSVALGCALYAGILAGRQKWPLLLDVSPRSYGIQVDDEPAFPMISKNVSFPTAARAMFASSGGGRGELRVRVYEGETELAATNPVFGEVVLEPNRDCDGRAQLSLTLLMDANGEIDLEVWDVRGGPPTRHRLQPSPDVVRGIATADGAFRPRPSGSTAPASRRPRRKVLAVATEWASGAGGLSTFNREFCLALSAAGHEVRCLVKSADTPDRQAAEEGGVMLIEAARTPGQSDESLLSRKPRMPDEWIPDLVIGHGRVTGPAAAALVEDFYKQAERMHLFHMAPDEIEWFKEEREDDAGERAEERTRIERQLGADARYAVAVGPRLHDYYLADFTATTTTPIRLDPGFDSRGTTPIDPPGGGPHTVLLVGRAEDEKLKGLDIAARALGSVFRDWMGTEFRLLVRGAPAGESEALRNSLREWADATALKVVVRPYTTQSDDLSGDYRRASLVLMPSRAEGFGLVGLEAICAGVPTLVSSESGLAGLLRERLDPEECARVVVPVVDDVEADTAAWANAIERVLLDRPAAFATAARLQALLGATANWAAAVAALTDQMTRSGGRAPG